MTSDAMTEQLGLFDQQTESDDRARHRASWGMCWDWTPQVGQMAAFANTCETDVNGQGHYVYMAACQILAHPADDQWIVQHYPYTGDTGQRFVIHDTGLWPCISHFGSPKLITTLEHYRAELKARSEWSAKCQAEYDARKRGSRKPVNKQNNERKHAQERHISKSRNRQNPRSK